MRTIRNLTMRPLRVSLPQGKTLHLGPRQEAQIATRNLERAGIVRLVEAGEIEVVDEAHGPSQAPDGTLIRPDSHGHHPDLTVKRRGDR